MTKNVFLEIFQDIQKNVNVEEGEHGLIVVLAAIARFPDEPMKKIAHESNLPVPLCVAIRNEFINKKLCKRGKVGSYLTKEGEKVLASLSVFNQNLDFTYCDEQEKLIPLEKYKKELNIISKFCELRGEPDTSIDQSFATPETSLSRVLLMSHHYDLFRRNFAFIGDSDLTSVALALFTHSDATITVFDINRRLEEIFYNANKELNKNIRFIEHDLRNPISYEFQDNFDCVITDPPYTREGCSLFLSRGMELLSSNKLSVIYLSFPFKKPREQLEVQKDLHNMNCYISNVYPRFNRYIGAQKIGGVSAFYRLVAVPPLSPIVSGIFEGSIYTGEKTPTVRFYECQNCKKTLEVGYDRKYNTIEQLKKAGCPFCSQKKFVKKGEQKIE
ncbi:MAG: bis-aminopropyl spermidine synthase family protein [Candidatus Thorarchaeota archaeon]